SAKALQAIDRPLDLVAALALLLVEADGAFVSATTARSGHVKAMSDSMRSKGHRRAEVTAVARLFPGQRAPESRARSKSGMHNDGSPPCEWRGPCPLCHVGFRSRAWSLPVSLVGSSRAVSRVRTRSASRGLIGS